MSDAWYEVVEASTRLTQGDIIFDCPISTWAEEAKVNGALAASAEVPEATPQTEVLKKRHEIIAEDVIVMTQACDLEHGKVSDVVVCPHYALSYFREHIWKPDQERKQQKTNSETWQKHFKGMADGHLWNLCVVNRGVTEFLCKFATLCLCKCPEPYSRVSACFAQQSPNRSPKCLCSLCQWT